jgi:hypothetical protein
MNYEEKVEYAIKDISSRLRKTDIVFCLYPFPFKILKKFGIKLAPPFFQKFLFNTVFFGIIWLLFIFIPIWICLTLLYGTVSYQSFTPSIIGTVTGGIIMASHCRKKAISLRLPSWDKYPDKSYPPTGNQLNILPQTEINNERRFSMKNVAKWIAIVWSGFCLIGIVYGMANVGKMKDTSPKSEYTEAGKAIGVGCGLGMWAGIWLAIAGPATIIYLLSGKKTVIAEVIVESNKTGTLCAECGKYYEGKQNFCPNCGKPIGSIK